jgi:hypothetical protein
MKTVLCVNRLQTLTRQIARAPARTGREGQQAQIAGRVDTIREGRRITGQVILTIPFFGQSGRKPGLPQGLGLLVGKSQGIGPQHEIVKGLAQPVEDCTPIGQVQTWVAVLFIQAAPGPAMGATLPGQTGHTGGHDGFSMKAGLP